MDDGYSAGIQLYGRANNGARRAARRARFADCGSALRNILCDALSPFRGFRAVADIHDLDPEEVKSASTKSK
jgi:hypothetical protein